MFPNVLRLLSKLQKEADMQKKLTALIVPLPLAPFANVSLYSEIKEGVEGRTSSCS